MKHINLSNYKGSITDWTILNYVKGGLADNLADIVNIKVNDSCYNYLAKSVNLWNPSAFTWQTGNLEQDNPERCCSGYKIFIKAGTYSFKSNIPYNYALKVNSYETYNRTPGDIYHDDAWRTAGSVAQFTIARDGYLGIQFACPLSSLNAVTNKELTLVQGTTLPTAYEPYGALVIHQNAGIVDLGSLDWIYRNNMFACYDVQTEINKPASDSVIANISCSKYETQSRDYVQSHSGYCGANISGTIVINDESFEGDVQAFKTAMSGVILKYELANPTIIVIDENGEVASTTAITRTANTLAMSDDALELDNTTDEVSVEQDSTNEIEIEEES